VKNIVRGIAVLLMVGVLFLGSNIVLQAQGEASLRLVGHLDLPMKTLSFGPTFSLSFKTMDLWREGDIVAIAAHDEIYLVDISDVQNPTIASTIALPQGNVSWDVKIQNNILYAALQISQSGDTLLIYDISDSTAPTLLSTYHSDVFAGAHNFFIAGNVGFVASLSAFGNGGSQTPQSINNGVWMVDLSDPANPIDIGPITAEDGTQITNVHDITVVGNRLYVAGWNNGFWLVDFENLDNPSELAYTVVANERYKPFLQPASVPPSAHNIWPSADGNLVWTTDEVIGEGVRVFDISNPDNIQLVGFFRLANDLLPHNVIVDGDYAYVAHYLGGLQVLKQVPLRGPVEVAQFETAPGQPRNVAFSGSFGVYPFGDHVLISDMLGGLYILEKGGALRP
jgi:choice-of-anchor B domain-containing protein